MTVTEIEDISKYAYNYSGSLLRKSQTHFAWEVKRLVILVLADAFGFSREKIVEIYGETADKQYDTLLADARRMLRDGEDCKQYAQLMIFLRELKHRLKNPENNG